RRNPSRRRLSSMFSRTSPSSQSYQVATLCGDPSGRSVATTAGFGRRRNSSTSGGTGVGGTAGRIQYDTMVLALSLCSAPLVGVAIALAALHEPLRAPLLLGAVLIVAGGAALATERARPEHVRRVGLAFAAAAAALFASRDNLVRWLAVDASSRPGPAAA